MRRGKQIYDWFPLWSDKWLFGSTRHELTHEQRAIWTDLMAVGNKDDGFIRANETTGYPPEQLAGLLCCSQELLETTIKICIEKGKLEDRGNCIYYICNWENYQLSGRYKRLIAEKAEVASEKTDASNLISSSVLSYSFPKGEFEGIQKSDVEAWSKAYPACDIKAELLKMAEWIKANPAKGKKSNYRRFIVNWLSRSQDRGGTVGAANKPKTKEEKIAEIWAEAKK